MSFRFYLQLVHDAGCFVIWKDYVRRGELHESGTSGGFGDVRDPVRDSGTSGIRGRQGSGEGFGEVRELGRDSGRQGAGEGFGTSGSWGGIRDVR